MPSRPRRPHRRYRAAPTAALILLALALAAALPATAAASRGRTFTTTIGERCTQEPCAGALKAPVAVAVDEATGQIYVVDQATNRVVRYSAAGAYEPEGELDGGGTHPWEITAAGHGGQPGEAETGAFQEPDGIAADNSCTIRSLPEPACAEQDPSNGDIYILDAGHRVIDKYNAAGRYLAQITGDAGGPFTEPVEAITTTPDGKLWLYTESGQVDQYDDQPANHYQHSAGHLPAGTGFAAPNGIAVDPAGELYLRHTVLGGARILKAEPSPTGGVLHVTDPELTSQNSSAVTVEADSANALTDNLTSIAVLNASGHQLERLGEEHGAHHLTEGAGLSVDQRTGNLYVTDTAAGELAVFGPAPPGPPSAEELAASAVTSATATLEASIDPNSETGATGYHLQYGACPSLPQCPASPYEHTAPEPERRLNPSFQAQHIEVPISGLTPHTTYHYRLIAENNQGPFTSIEANLTTQGPGGPFTPPDDRGFELVSPPDKQGALIEPITEAGVIQAAADGHAITYLTNSPTEPDPQGAANKSQILSTRQAGAWSSLDISLPHPSAPGSSNGEGQEYKAFDPELTQAVVQPFGEYDPLLSTEASEQTAYLHTLTGGCAEHCFQPLVSGKPGHANVPPETRFGEEGTCKPKVSGTGATHVICGPEYLAANETLTHIVLRSTAPLTPGAAAGQLYEWAEGELHPVSALAGNTPAANAPTLGFDKDLLAGHAISSNGSRVIWSAEAANPREPELYLRDTSREETIPLDQAEGCTGCTSGGGEFQTADSEGTRILFTDSHRLSADAGATGTDLYECRVLTREEHSACQLTDLTPPENEEPARVLGRLPGAGEELSYIYFVAAGIQSGEPNSQGQHATSGQPNLYVRHDGHTRFIATLSPPREASAGDDHDWGGETSTPTGQPTRASPNGQWLELMSEAPLSGYDNRDRRSGRPAAEVYLYDAVNGKLSCASCDPTGERPDAVEYQSLEPGSGGLVGGPRNIWPAEALVAANVPGTEAIATGGQVKERYQPRYLDDEGRLFFDTVNGLAPQDSNETQDVYEYEPPATGSGSDDCSESSESFSERAGGCVSLVSAAASGQESAFLDASETGDDVFLLTAARLSSLDTDSALDVYDAHVCASASPCIIPQASATPPCASESSCRAAATPEPSIFTAPASATFTGPAGLSPKPPTVLKPASAAQIRARKLDRALRACRRYRKRSRRRACERTARRRYAPRPVAHRGR